MKTLLYIAAAGGYASLTYGLATGTLDGVQHFFAVGTLATIGVMMLAKAIAVNVE